MPDIQTKKHVRGFFRVHGGHQSVVIHRGKPWRQYALQAAWRRNHGEKNRCFSCKCYHTTEWPQSAFDAGGAESLCVICVRRALKKWMGELEVTCGFLGFRGPEE